MSLIKKRRNSAKKSQNSVKKTRKSNKTYKNSIKKTQRTIRTIRTENTIKKLNNGSIDKLYKLLINGNEIVSFFKESNELCDFIRMNKRRILMGGYKGNVLGRGFGGIVYDLNLKINGIPVVIKKAKINTKVLCQEDNEYVKRCGKYISESCIGSIINTLYEKGISPNFIRTFHSFVCLKKKAGFQILEKIDGTLEDLDKMIDKYDLIKKTNMTPTEIKTNAIFQTVHALMTQQNKYGITHSDLKPDNVFIKILTNNDIYKGKRLINQKYFIYKVKNKNIKIKNPGFLVKIGDFGQSRAFKIKTAFTNNLQIKRQLIDEKGIRKFAKLLPKNEFIKREIIRQEEKFDSLFRPTIDLQFLMNNLLYDKNYSGLSIVNEFFTIVEDKLCKQQKMCNIDRYKVFIPKTKFAKFPTSRYPIIPATITPYYFLIHSNVFKYIITKIK